MNNENWEKEFEEFCKGRSELCFQECHHEQDILKDFIRSLLASHSAELCERLDKEMKEKHDPIENCNYDGFCSECLQTDEFNAGLSRAKDIIKDNQK